MTRDPDILEQLNKENVTRPHMNRYANVYGAVHERIIYFDFDINKYLGFGVNFNSKYFSWNFKFDVDPYQWTRIQIDDDSFMRSLGSLKPLSMDKITSLNKIYLTISDNLERDEKIAVVPLEISLEFRNKIRRGMSTKFGFGQEIKASVEGIKDYFNLTLGECETVHNPYRNKDLEPNKGLSFYT